MNRFLLIAVGIALGCVGVSYALPLSTTSVDIVRLQDSSEPIVLHSKERLSQRIHLSVGTYSGIVFYSDAPTLDGRQFLVTMKDRAGDVVARGRTAIVSYEEGAEVLQVDVPISWFQVVHDDFYVVHIELVYGDELQLRAIARDSNLSAVHKLALDDVSQDAILSLSIQKRTEANFGLRQGLLIGSAFLLGTALIATLKNQQRKFWAAVVLIILFAPLALLGYFFSAGDLGIADWDFYFTLHDSYRKAILEHHTFPFWNPYICGGTAGLGDPEFPVFSPTFLLELVFGIPLGIRLAIALSVIVGATGMLALSRSLGRSVEAGLISALAVSFGTVSLLEITEGHVNVLAAMWIPWILWAWLGAYRGNKRPIICGTFLALAFLGGGIYLLMYTAFAFIALCMFVQKKRKAVLLTVQSGFWALGLVAFKLVPVLYWLKQFPDDAYQSSAYTLPWIVDILFGRHIHGAYIIYEQASGWHEYGAYIGYVVFALALLGISYLRKSRVVFALAVSSCIALLVSAFGPQLEGVFDPLWFFPRSNISRLILFAVIPIALLAAYGSDKIAAIFPNKGKAVRALLVGIVAIDIISLTYQLSEQAFILPHVVPQISPAPYPIAFTPGRYDQSGEGSRTTRSYDAYTAGYGTLVYCSVLGPTPGVRTIHDEGDTSVVTAGDQNARVSLVSWSYNAVRVHVETPTDTQIVVNTNYVDGWTVNGKKASIVSNLVAADISKGEHELEFKYTAPGFTLGLSITLFTMVALAYLMARWWKGNTKTQ